MREPASQDVQAVKAHLLGRGYQVVSERHDEALFGDSEVTFGRGATLVRIVRDRGQWFIEITGRDWGDWFAPVMWRALLTQLIPAPETIPFEKQVQLLLEDLDRVEALTTGTRDGNLGRLRELRARRAEARRALPPDGGVTG